MENIKYDKDPDDENNNVARFVIVITPAGDTVTLITTECPIYPTDESTITITECSI